MLCKYSKWRRRYRKQGARCQSDGDKMCKLSTPFPPGGGSSSSSSSSKRGSGTENVEKQTLRFNLPFFVQPSRLLYKLSDWNWREMRIDSWGSGSQTRGCSLITLTALFTPTYSNHHCGKWRSYWLERVAKCFKSGQSTRGESRKKFQICKNIAKFGKSGF